MNSLNTLYQRREQRLLNFAVKCVNDKFSTHISQSTQINTTKRCSKLTLPKQTDTFKSTVPQCQRLLNEYARDNPNFIPAEKLISTVFHFDHI